MCLWWSSRVLPPGPARRSACFNITCVFSTLLYSTLIVDAVKYFFGIDINICMKHKHHIIPRHMGGTDDPSNLIELTPEEHAEAHRLLYEEHGHWQDRVAWIGLAGLATKAEHVAMLLSEAGKKGAAISNADGGWRKKNPEAAKRFSKMQSERMKKQTQKGINNNNAKEFTVVHPDGTQEKIKALKTWCESKGLNYNSFHNQCVGRKKSHKGYSILL